jgi:hypothetical protein
MRKYEGMSNLKVEIKALIFDICFTSSGFESVFLIKEVRILL